MKNYSLLFLSILIIIILSNSCCKDVNCPELTADDKSWIPYKENDTLVFKNFENGSVLKYYIYSKIEDNIYVDATGYSCSKDCLKGYQVSIFPISTKDNNRFFYYIEKSESTLYVACSSRGYNSLIVNDVNPASYFDLRKSNHIESLMIAGMEVFDVYEYITKEDYVENIRKMYIKKGKGILRIDFEDNQSFELENILNHEKQD
jgi:hypothetical protein